MKGIAIVLFFSLLLGGCAQKKQEPVDRVVTGIQVRYEHQDNTLLRNYTKPSSVRSILTYLRFLKPFGPVIPEGQQDTTCQFTLHYSHGPDSVYMQRGHKYLRRDDGDWQTISTSHASLLYPILLLLPSD